MNKYYNKVLQDLDDIVKIIEALHKEIIIIQKLNNDDSIVLDLQSQITVYGKI